MTESFLALTANDRREAIGVAAEKVRRPPHLLEKDVWVVWTLDRLFSAPFGKDLIFKGGTSLSKAYHAIQRFSEDIDVTYDIRAFAPDLVRGAPDELPPNASQANRWTRKINEKLARWVSDEARPAIESALHADGIDATITVEATSPESLLIDFGSLFEPSPYTSSVVRLDFGARSSGEPSQVMPVTCDAAPALPDVHFPSARPRVMAAERTFWEKATAIHVCALGGKLPSKTRYARHWYDVTQLDLHGFADLAIADKALALKVASHKRLFFSEKDGKKERVDYLAAVTGSLRLVPEGEMLAAIAADYAQMIKDGLLLDKPCPLNEILDHCRDVERRANAATPAAIP